jgi:hypothetical protein
LLTHHLLQKEKQRKTPRQRSKILKHYLPRFTALALILIGGAFVPAMKADEWNKKTDITISQPIEIQGTVLPAGSYVIKLLDLPAGRHAVQIFNAEQNHIITTILAVPTYRFRPTDKLNLTSTNSRTVNPRPCTPGSILATTPDSSSARAGKAPNPRDAPWKRRLPVREETNNRPSLRPLDADLPAGGFFTAGLH